MSFSQSCDFKFSAPQVIYRQRCEDLFGHIKEVRPIYCSKEPHHLRVSEAKPLAQRVLLFSCSSGYGFEVCLLDRYSVAANLEPPWVRAFTAWVETQRRQ